MKKSKKKTELKKNKTNKWKADVLRENQLVSEPIGLAVRIKPESATVDGCFVLIGIRQYGVAKNKPST